MCMFVCVRVCVRERKREREREEGEGGREINTKLPHIIIVH